nr:l-arabinose-responsive transcription regulator ara1 [Quercus suber]
MAKVTAASIQYSNTFRRQFSRSACLATATLDVVWPSKFGITICLSLPWLLYFPGVASAWSEWTRTSSSNLSDFSENGTQSYHAVRDMLGIPDDPCRDKGQRENERNDDHKSDVSRSIGPAGSSDKYISVDSVVWWRGIISLQEVACAESSTADTGTRSHFPARTFDGIDNHNLTTPLGIIADTTVSLHATSERREVGKVVKVVGGQTVSSMAEAITIPSPSVFLRNSPPPSSATPPLSSNEAVQQDGGDIDNGTAARNTGERQIKDKKRRPAPIRNPSVSEPVNISATAVEDVGAGAEKPKKSKSRNGCVTCKAKRLKCDEEKPTCLQCAKRKVDCGGYKKDFKWRPFEETNVKLMVDRQQQGKTPLSAFRGQMCVKFITISVVSPAKATTSSPGKSALAQGAPRRPSVSRAGSDGLRRDSKRSSTAGNGPITALPQRPAKAKRKNKVQTPENNSVMRQETEQAEANDGISLPGVSLPANVSDFSQSRNNTVRDPSPTLTEILQPPRVEDTSNEDFINFSLPEGMEFPLIPSPTLSLDPELFEDQASYEDVEEAGGNFDGSPSKLPLFTSSRRQSASPTQAISMKHLLQLWQGPTSYLNEQPYFSPDSPEMLSCRFDRLTCGILSVMDGPTENPWRTLIWPLAQHSPALYHAIFAMTAFHSSMDVPELRLVGHEHKQASIRYIQEGIRDSSIADQTAIATALALGFSESWDQHTATGNTHIKGAQALVKRVLEAHKTNPLDSEELARLKFLCNAWVYMDVIARLTSVDSDESNDFDQTFFFDPVSPQSDASGFGLNFGMPIDARLDPLMGCANTLFPLIGRVANLVRKVCRSQTNSPAVITQANDLKLALETWDPPDFIEGPEDPTTDVQHTLQTAEAYRWATLLHLHQSVPELPSMTSADLARRVLQYLATVPLASRTVVVHVFPMMVASCEAKSDEDREWVKLRWEAMRKRMRLGIIEKSALVTEEVWRRRDAYEAQPTTRRRLVATADLRLVRQRDTPLPHIDMAQGDPGRTGMVFTYVDGDSESKPSAPINEQRGAWGKTPNRMLGSMDAAYTVRGHLHWVGVMWDWGWENQRVRFGVDQGNPFAQGWRVSALLSYVSADFLGPRPASIPVHDNHRQRAHELCLTPESRYALTTAASNEKTDNPALVLTNFIDLPIYQSLAAFSSSDFRGKGTTVDTGWVPLLKARSA